MYLVRAAGIVARRQNEGPVRPLSLHHPYTMHYNEIKGSSVINLNQGLQW